MIDTEVDFKEIRDAFLTTSALFLEDGDLDVRYPWVARSVTKDWQGEVARTAQAAS